MKKKQKKSFKHQWKIRPHKGASTKYLRQRKWREPFISNVTRQRITSIFISVHLEKHKTNKAFLAFCVCDAC